MNLPAKRYTEEQLDRAKDTQRVIGWIQGGGAVLAGAILWNFLGWIPVALVVLAVGWVVVKLLAGGGEDEEGQGGDPVADALDSARSSG